MQFVKIPVLGASAVLVAFTAFRAVAGEASASDLAQADKFLAEIPPACAKSYKSVGSDGSVRIHILCSGNGKTTDGLVVIRNGVVTKIR